jgi:hypothetical protein
MVEPSANPYQPPRSATAHPSDISIDEIRFHLTKQNLRHGLSHHLIRCRPYAVTLVSVAMIVFSLAVFTYTVYLVGNSWALAVMPILLGLSALAYQSVVAKASRATSDRMAECGLVQGADVNISPSEDFIIVKTHSSKQDETLRWKRDEIKTYPTTLGFMIVPETYVFLFLPRKGQFDSVTYQAIKQLFKKR